jgi:DNA-binding protein H-NS
MASQNYASLQAKINKEIEKLQKQAQQLQSKSRKPVMNAIIRSMKEYGITPEDVSIAFGKTSGASKSSGTKPPKASKRAATKKPVAPKYRHPESGATWTGRGKAPLWVMEAEKNGQMREQFLI